MLTNEKFEQISQCQNHLALSLQKDEQIDDCKVIIASNFETELDLKIMLIKLFSQEPQMMETFRKVYNFMDFVNSQNK